MSDHWDKIKNFTNRIGGLAKIGFSDILSNAISAGFWIYIASILGVENYGKVSFLLAIGSIASTISMAGSPNMLLVYTAKKIRIESGVYLIAIIGAFISAIIVFFIFFNIAISIYIIGAVIFGLATSEILGKKLYNSYPAYIITQKILMIGLAVLLYYFIGLSGIIIGIALSFFPYSHRIYKGFKESKIDFSLIRSHTEFMINSFIQDLSASFHNSIDKIIIVPILGFALLGNYQLGIQFITILQILPSIVYKYTLPHDAGGNSNKLLKKGIILVSIGFTILGIFVSPLLIPILFPKFTSAIAVVQILSLSLIPNSIIVNYQSKFFGSERSRIIIISSGIYIATQTILIILFGKVFGINGVAVALVLASIAQCGYFVTMDKIIKKKSI